MGTRADARSCRVNGKSPRPIPEVIAAAFRRPRSIFHALFSWLLAKALMIVAKVKAFK
jgi:hypothetical protein